MYCLKFEKRLAYARLSIGYATAETTPSCARVRLSAQRSRQRDRDAQGSQYRLKGICRTVERRNSCDVVR